MTRSIFKHKSFTTKPKLRKLVLHKQLLLGLLCDHAVVDSKGYVCCIHNLEAPSYCLPENCPFLRGVFGDS